MSRVPLTPLASNDISSAFCTIIVIIKVTAVIDANASDIDIRNNNNTPFIDRYICISGK